jgi:hypothetical protein
MEHKNGCELIGCKYYKNGVCIDDDPKYAEICRYNPHWREDVS